MLYTILCYHSERVVGSWTKEEDDATMVRLAAVQQKLRQLVRAIDPHPIVMELAQVRVPWAVSAVP